MTHAIIQAPFTRTPPHAGSNNLPTHIGSYGLIGEATSRALRRIGQFCHYPANTHLDDMGTGPALGFVMRGYVRLQQYRADGRRSIVSLVTPGAMVGDTVLQRKGFTLQTATEMTLFRFEPQEFQYLVENLQELARAVYLLQTIKLDQLGLMTWIIGALNAEERICAFLALATRFMPYVATSQTNGVLTLDLPRADIADLLGTSVESISRTIKRLSQIGVLDVLGPRGFGILDLPRLIEMGCLQDTFHLIQWPRTLAVTPADFLATGSRRNVEASPIAATARKASPLNG